MLQKEILRETITLVRIYFVRHAQPEHEWEEDRTRPLTAEGEQDSKKVLEFFKDKHIDKFYSSPYKRSIDTIAETAKYFGKEIVTDERLREREKGPNGNNHGMFHKRWSDHNFHEEGGESLSMVQERNMAALYDILQECSCHMVSDNEEKEINLVIGTHGTALSSILCYYDKHFNCDSFLRIIDWMPYIVEIDFEKEQLFVNLVEHIYVHKEFKEKKKADQ